MKPLTYRFVLPKHLAEQGNYFIYFQARGEMQCVVEINGKDYYNLYFSTPSALAFDSLIGEANIVVIPELTQEQVHKAMNYLLFDGMRDYFKKIKKFPATIGKTMIQAEF
jgi:hypothetical protein